MLALLVPRWLGIDLRWGAAGLTTAGGLGAWVEYLLLRSAIRRRVGPVRLPFSYTGVLWVAATLAAAAGFAARLALPLAGRFTSALVVFGTFGLVYLSATYAVRIPEAGALVGRVTRLARR
jgi:hypothetical protein